MNTDHIFKSLFAEDVEGKKLYKQIPDAKKVYDEYKEKCLSIGKEIFDFGKSQKIIRDKEVDEFWKCFNEAKESNTNEATVAIDVFTEYKKTVSI